MTHRRTTRLIAVVVDTDGLTDKEHLRRVHWAEENLTKALRNLADSAVTIVIADDDGKVVESATYGGPPEEERFEVATDLLEGKRPKES